MTNRHTRRRNRNAADRRVWVFSALNRDLRPEHLAKIITSAGLEQARLEAEARAQQEADHSVTPEGVSSDADTRGAEHA